MSESSTLYDRMGGDSGLDKMVALLYERVLSDPELSPFFKKTSVARLRRMQVEFMRAALGGPSQYSGLALGYAHAKRGITVKHFNQFCQHMFAAMEEMGTDHATVQEVVAHLATYKNFITGDAY